MFHTWIRGDISHQLTQASLAIALAENSFTLANIFLLFLLLAKGEIGYDFKRSEVRF